MELHWFLPAPLLQSVLLKEENDNQHCCCHPPPEKRSRKTVADIFTWLLCFNRYAAAQCAIYPGLLPHMMAYANTIIQAYLQFSGDGWRQYDRAFRIQAATRRTTDWTSADPSLYARLVACQSRRASTCQFCCSSSHKSSACPWGIDEPSAEEPPPLPPFRRRAAATLARSDPPICMSWNAGACRFPGTCTYRHVCSSCSMVGHRSAECRRGPQGQGVARAPPATKAPPPPLGPA